MTGVSGDLHQAVYTPIDVHSDNSTFSVLYFAVRALQHLSLPGECWAKAFAALPEALYAADKLKQVFMRTSVISFDAVLLPYWH
jgi:hypothetical protein